MFTRIGAAAYKANLDNIISLCNYFNNPEEKFKCIHIAGTNGKGSTSHMLASILMKAGYKTALFTSPHLTDYRERIKINGKMISESEVIKFLEGNIDYFNSIQPSFFEITTAMAFDYFANEEVDIAIIETGLGGRLDSTNIITPLLSIITNISWDHKDLLGDTLEKIAFEKAGIIKKNIPIVVSESQPYSQPVFISKSNESNSTITFADKVYHFISKEKSDDRVKYSFKKENENISVICDLEGDYQSKNIAAVLTACDILNSYAFYINDNSIHYGLYNVKLLSGLRGRWQILQNTPLTIADVGHNEDGLKSNIQQLLNISEVKKRSFLDSKIHFIIGFVKDKDISSILRLFPKDAHYYLCSPSLPRALKVEDLATEFNKLNFTYTTYQTVKDALDSSRSKADKNDIIFIGGSTFVVSEVL